MNQTRRVLRMALSAIALIAAVLAGAAIGRFATSGAPPITGNWQPPAVITTPEPALSPSAAPSAAPTAEPSPSPEPEPPTPSVFELEPPTPTVAEPEPSPTLEPVEVETPAPTATPEAPASPYIEYVVQPGDILNRIAQRFGVTPAAIRELNPEIDPDSLTVGEVLLIPRD